MANPNAPPISRESANRLLRQSDDHLPSLLCAAQAARAHRRPGVVTYSRKVFIPLTNLCRDYCGYCTFRRDPGQVGAHTMSPDEVMEVVRAGERMGCTEALFSLGDKPELLFPEMRDTLRRFGYKSTLHYLEAMCEKVLRESRLLPHPNPGLMSAEWLDRLARVSPSMGLMLETTSPRLLAENAAHDNAPDKDPAKRLRVIAHAGRRKIPFTTGILIGIGETLEERVDALIAIRDLHEEYGHIQEVIVQNFRAKPGTPMALCPEPDRHDMLRTLAVARLLMPAMNIQAPPNLSDPHYADLLDAGINDWGGVSPLTPDFINPESPGRISMTCKNVPRPRDSNCAGVSPSTPNSPDSQPHKALCWRSVCARSPTPRATLAPWEKARRHDHRSHRRHRRRKVRRWSQPRRPA